MIEAKAIGVGVYLVEVCIDPAGRSNEESVISALSIEQARRLAVALSNAANVARNNSLKIFEGRIKALLSDKENAERELETLTEEVRKLQELCHGESSPDLAKIDAALLNAGYGEQK